MIHVDRWELGSEFHWPLEAEPDATRLPWTDGRALLGSGRDALRLVVSHGRATHGWQRLWLPSYLCQHVVEAIVHTGIACTTYVDAPTLSGPDPSSLTPAAEDVVLLVNYFGLREASVVDDLQLEGASLIVDHTHDPWSDWAKGGGSDYAVASLRKTLPIPEGGLLWSPNGHSLPELPSVTAVRAEAAAAKWKAMRLKGHYLAGEEVAKADFRALANHGEATIASGEVSGMSPTTAMRLADLPVASWRQKRRRNFCSLQAALEGQRDLTVLAPAGDACPFSVFVVFDDAARRERVRAAMIDARCYPAILWPMDALVIDGVPAAHQELAACSLSVPCDMRYGDGDMARLAQVMLAALA